MEASVLCFLEPGYDKSLEGGALAQSLSQRAAQNSVIPLFMLKPCTDRMHDLGSIVPHIQPKVFTDNHMS
jgi:hypothetical protein